MLFSQTAIDNNSFSQQSDELRIKYMEDTGITMDEHVHISTNTVNFGYDVTQSSTDDFSLHCHTFYEAYYFLEGNVEYQVEGHKYVPAPHSLLLLSPHTFHGVKILDDQCYRRFSLHFHPNILTMERRQFLLSSFSSFTKQPERISYFENLEASGLAAYFEAIKECSAMDEKIKEQILPITIEALLSRVIQTCGQKSPFADDQPSDTISQIIWYLNCHLQEEITLDQLSDHFYISKHHLNKVFRKATGTTVIDYLLRKRVATAQQLLVSGASAQEASLKSGFSDYSAFYRAYTRILGHSPREDKGALPSLQNAEAGFQVLNLEVGEGFASQ